MDGAWKDEEERKTAMIHILEKYLMGDTFCTMLAVGTAYCISVLLLRPILRQRKEYENATISSVIFHRSHIMLLCLHHIDHCCVCSLTCVSPFLSVLVRLAVLFILL